MTDLASPPDVIAQLSDPHIRVGRNDAAAARALSAAVAAVLAQDPAARAVLITGDLGDSGSTREYERVRDLLEPLPMPVHVMAGNHDDRDAMRAVFGLPPTPDRRIEYTAIAGMVRIIVCDTTLPGRDDGRLDAPRLEWLESQLGLEPKRPTLVAMHHPPLLTGIRALDDSGLPLDDRRALSRLLAERERRNIRVVAGHVHRAVFAGLAACQVFACPSVHLEVRLELASHEPLSTVADHPGIALHVLVDGELTTHVEAVRG